MVWVTEITKEVTVALEYQVVGEED
jgi:hypothetical protein